MKRPFGRERMMRAGINGRLREDTTLVKSIVVSPNADEVTAVAVRALGEIGDRQALEALLRLCSADVSSAVVAELATALTSLGDRRAIDPLHHLARRWERRPEGEAISEAIRTLEKAPAS